MPNKSPATSEKAWLLNLGACSHSALWKPSRHGGVLCKWYPLRVMLRVLKYLFVILGMVSCEPWIRKIQWTIKPWLYLIQNFDDEVGIKKKSIIKTWKFKFSFHSEQRYWVFFVRGRQSGFKLLAHLTRASRGKKHAAVRCILHQSCSGSLFAATPSRSSIIDIFWLRTSSKNNQDVASAHKAARAAKLPWLLYWSDPCLWSSRNTMTGEALRWQGGSQLIYFHLQPW